MEGNEQQWPAVRYTERASYEDGQLAGNTMAASPLHIVTLDYRTVHLLICALGVESGGRKGE